MPSGEHPSPASLFGGPQGTVLPPEPSCLFRLATESGFPPLSPLPPLCGLPGARSSESSAAAVGLGKGDTRAAWGPRRRPRRAPKPPQAGCGSRPEKGQAHRKEAGHPALRLATDLLPLDSNLPYLSKRGAAPCPAPHPSPRCAPRGSEARLGRAGPRGGIHRATPPPCASARAAFVRTFPVAVRTMGSFHL